MQNRGVKDREATASGGDRGSQFSGGAGAGKSGGPLVLEADGANAKMGCQREEPAAPTRGRVRMDSGALHGAGWRAAILVHGEDSRGADLPFPVRQ